MAHSKRVGFIQVEGSNRFHHLARLLPTDLASTPLMAMHVHLLLLDPHSKQQNERFDKQHHRNAQQGHRHQSALDHVLINEYYHYYYCCCRLATEQFGIDSLWAKEHYCGIDLVRVPQLQVALLIGLQIARSVHGNETLVARFEHEPVGENAEIGMAREARTNMLMRPTSSEGAHIWLGYHWPRTMPLFTQKKSHLTMIWAHKYTKMSVRKRSCGMNTKRMSNLELKYLERGEMGRGKFNRGGRGDQHI